jgi:hypothetical protein
VVVDDGDTPAEPLVGFEPTPLSIDTDVAFVVDQFSVEDCPAPMNAGVAVNVMPGPLVTVTVAEPVMVPPGPFAVSVYVVVTAGWTMVDPDTGCDPTPLSIVTVVALVVLQISVEAWPVPTVLGDAEKETVGAGVVTVTVAVFVVVPPGPVAVSVYVVVDDGLTLVLPDVGLLPTPLSIEIDVAFDDVHVSVDDCPTLMVVGAAEKVAVGAAAETVTVA